jgi:hypothetical protein
MAALRKHGSWATNYHGRLPAHYDHERFPYKNIEHATSNIEHRTPNVFQTGRNGNSMFDVEC